MIPSPTLAHLKRHGLEGLFVTRANAQRSENRSKRTTTSSLGAVGLLALICANPALAGSDIVATGKTELTKEFVCRLIESSAQTQSLPAGFLTRLIWQESSFRADAISPAGAQGVAQFMPRTADERGVANPFDPEQAIQKAAQLLGDLRRRFGNLGLASAAYNAGAGRVSNWLAGRGDLPAETREYVSIVTGHSVEDWADQVAAPKLTDSAISSAMSCSQTTGLVRRSEPADVAGSTLFAPWGVQLAGSFSKAAALEAYARAQRNYSAILGNIVPMIMTGRMLGRGFSLFYAIRAPAPSRAAADLLCQQIRRAGGACAVLRS